MRFKCESVKVNVCARKSGSFEPGFFPRFSNAKSMGIVQW